MSISPQLTDGLVPQTTYAARVGLWDWDLRTNRVAYCAEWKRQLGYKEDEISNELREWESRVHPDDLPKIRARIAEYLRHPWPDYEDEFRIQRKDGSWCWMLARAGLVLATSFLPMRFRNAFGETSLFRAANDGPRARVFGMTRASGFCPKIGPRRGR